MIGEDGRMTDAAGRFAGLPVAEAREAVIAALREEGLIRDERPFVHSVPFSQRSGERIEPLISLQWFCRMDELAGPAIDVVERDEVGSPRGSGSACTSTGCATSARGASPGSCGGATGSRWYCDRCAEMWVAEQPPMRCGSCDGPLRQDEDVLDTWFSSALWPFATLGWPDDTPELRAFYPTDFLTTAREILFLWVARMVMMGLEFPGAIPFRDVYVHSVIQAPDGRRMSKSLGTGIDPLEEIDVYGADALRFGMLAMSSSQDVPYSKDRVQQGLDLANKMWNASRLILLNTPSLRNRAKSLLFARLIPGLKTGGSSRGCSARSRPSRATSTTTTTPMRRSSCTGSSGPSCATGISRSSSRACTSPSPMRRRRSPGCSSRCSRSLTRCSPS